MENNDESGDCTCDSLLPGDGLCPRCLGDAMQRMEREDMDREQQPPVAEVEELRATPGIAEIHASGQAMATVMCMIASEVRLNLRLQAEPFVCVDLHEIVEEGEPFVELLMTDGGRDGNDPVPLVRRHLIADRFHELQQPTQLPIRMFLCHDQSRSTASAIRWLLMLAEEY